MTDAVTSRILAALEALERTTPRKCSEASIYGIVCVTYDDGRREIHSPQCQRDYDVRRRLAIAQRIAALGDAREDMVYQWEDSDKPYDCDGRKGGLPTPEEAGVAAFASPGREREEP